MLNTLVTLLFSTFILSFSFPSRYRCVVSKSRCAALVLLEALLAGMAAEHRQDGGRYEVMDALSRELDVFIQA